MHVGTELSTTMSLIMLMLCLPFGNAGKQVKMEASNKTEKLMKISSSGAVPRDCEGWREDWRASRRLLEMEFMIDPDGPRGQKPFRVHCDMGTRPATTIVGHNFKGKTEVVLADSKADAAAFHVNYGKASMGQIVALITHQDGCSQHLRYDCHGSWLHDSTGKAWSHWWSRQGHKMPYFPGGHRRGVGCACAFDRTCDSGSNGLCNCDKNDLVWRSDEGSITDKALLPITKVTFADTDNGGERGFFTLGPLKCTPKKKVITTQNYTTAFFVTRTSSFGPFNVRTTVKWEHVITNLGLGWRQDANQFVTTTPGLYSFDISAASPNIKGLFLFVLKNGVEVMRVYTPYRPHATGSSHFVLLLNKGDIIKVQMEAGQTLYSDTNLRTHFSGYLVTPAP